MIGIIEIGSSAIRLLVTDTVFLAQGRSFRRGHKRIDLFSFQRSNEGHRRTILSEAIQTVDDFCRQIDSIGCDASFIYCTEPLRKFSDYFVQRVQTSDAKFQILSSRDEANCALAAGFIGMQGRRESCLTVLNQGAGSAEVSTGASTGVRLICFDFCFSNLGWNELAKIVAANSNFAEIEETLGNVWRKECGNFDFESAERIVLMGGAARDFGWITATPEKRSRLSPESLPHSVSRNSVLQLLALYANDARGFSSLVAEVSSSLPVEAFLGYLIILKLCLPSGDAREVFVSQLGTQYGFAWLALNEGW